MDAPQISTLNEDVSPPPQQSKPPIRSVKLVMKDEPPAQPPMHPFDLLAAAAAQSPLIPTSPSGSNSRKRRLSQVNNDDAAEDDEIEEDQLIDEDEPAAPKKRTPGKTKAKKEKTPTKLPKVTLNLSVPPPPSTAASSVASTDQADSEPPTKKKKTTKKAKPAAPTPVKSGIKLKLLPPQLMEDNISVASEGYTGTAASSPVNTHYGPDSPGPDEPTTVAPPQAPPLQEVAFPTREEDINASLEDVPVPSFPLPTKPFPVMPPPKLSSGLAPNIHFDKSGKPVRHWRTALREIRGIGGGRWFARTWVGDKESQFAASAAASKGGFSEPLSMSSGSVSPEKSSKLSKLAAVALGSPLAVPTLVPSTTVPSFVSSSPAPSTSTVVPVATESMMTHIPVSNSELDSLAM
ncbi:hypothetical protein DL96DRAFT_22960 [Flagelloscypha sp. PMI_526]|nr:hypothetical protein DL96DRAFT_22960 [Flagelloscypha sp. PMI_526]